jgi:hypothetical protein
MEQRVPPHLARGVPHRPKKNKDDREGPVRQRLSVLFLAKLVAALARENTR